MQKTDRDPPITNYDKLENAELIEQMRFLSEGEVQELLEYEESGPNRAEILDAIKRDLALRIRRPAR